MIKNCSNCNNHYKKFNGIAHISKCKIGNNIPSKFFPENYSCKDYRQSNFLKKLLSLLFLLVFVNSALLFSANFNSNKRRTVFHDNHLALELKTDKKVDYEEFCRVALSVIPYLENLDLKNIYEYWNGDIDAFVEYFKRHPTCIPEGELK